MESVSAQTIELIRRVGLRDHPYTEDLEERIIAIAQKTREQQAGETFSFEEAVSAIAQKYVSENLTLTPRVGVAPHIVVSALEEVLAKEPKHYPPPPLDFLVFKKAEEPVKCSDSVYDEDVEHFDVPQTYSGPYYGPGPLYRIQILNLPQGKALRIRVNADVVHRYFSADARLMQMCQDVLKPDVPNDLVDKIIVHLQDHGCNVTREALNMSPTDTFQPWQIKMRY
jgi:hypothetical protein